MAKAADTSGAECACSPPAASGTAGPPADRPPLGALCLPPMMFGEADPVLVAKGPAATSPIGPASVAADPVYGDYMDPDTLQAAPAELRHAPMPPPVPEPMCPDVVSLFATEYSGIPAFRSRPAASGDAPSATTESLTPPPIVDSDPLCRYVQSLHEALLACARPDTGGPTLQPVLVFVEGDKQPFTVVHLDANTTVHGARAVIQRSGWVRLGGAQFRFVYPTAEMLDIGVAETAVRAMHLTDSTVAVHPVHRRLVTFARLQVRLTGTLHVYVRGRAPAQRTGGLTRAQSQPQAHVVALAIMDAAAHMPAAMRAEIGQALLADAPTGRGSKLLRPAEPSASSASDTCDSAPDSCPGLGRLEAEHAPKRPHAASMGATDSKVARVLFPAPMPGDPGCEAKQEPWRRVGRRRRGKKRGGRGRSRGSGTA